VSRPIVEIARVEKNRECVRWVRDCQPKSLNVVGGRKIIIGEAVNAETEIRTT